MHLSLLLCRKVKEDTALMRATNSKMLSKLTSKCPSVDALLDKVEAMGMHVELGEDEEGKELRDLPVQARHIPLDLATAALSQRS